MKTLAKIRKQWNWENVPNLFQVKQYISYIKDPFDSLLWIWGIFSPIW